MGTKAPPTQTQGKLCKEASCQLPRLATKGGAAWSAPSQATSPSFPRPAAYSGNQAQSLTSLCPMGLGWKRGSQLWVSPHQRVLSLSLGGWKLLFDMSIKALGRMQTHGSKVSRGSVRQGACAKLTSWGAGGTAVAVARPAQWQ